MGMKLPPELERKILEQAGDGRVGVIELPAPPSANNLFFSIVRFSKKQNRHVVCRVKTDAYQEWEAAVASTVKRLASPTSYPVGIEYTLIGKWNRARDGQNVLKAIPDAMKTNGVLANDNLLYITGEVWRYEPGPGEPRVRVRLIELTGGLFQEVLR